jgi:hypothetical protein
MRVLIDYPIRYLLDVLFSQAYNPSYSGVVSDLLTDREEGHWLEAFTENNH